MQAGFFALIQLLAFCDKSSWSFKLKQSNEGGIFPRIWRIWKDKWLPVTADFWLTNQWFSEDIFQISTWHGKESTFWISCNVTIQWAIKSQAFSLIHLLTMIKWSKSSTMILISNTKLNSVIFANFAEIEIQFKGCFISLNIFRRLRTFCCRNCSMRRA